MDRVLNNAATIDPHVQLAATAILEREAFSAARITGRPHYSLKLEREVTYLCHPAMIDSLLQSQGSQFESEGNLISQGYFPKRSFDRVLKIARRLARDELDIFDGGVAQCRLRHEISTHQERFLLEIKGKRQGDAKSERVELSIDIDRSDFKRFSRDLRAGVVGKSRLVIRPVPSSAHFGGAEAHVDRIIASGAEAKLDAKSIWRQASRRKSQSSFVLVDLEAPTRAGIAELSTADHPFSSVIQSGVNLNTQPQSIRKLFSMQEIAQNGLQREALLAARLLLPN